MSAEERAAISVVIPVFNEAKSLGDLHDRLTQTLKQLGQSHEIIFVDDGSRDGSTDILRALHTQDRAVRVIRFNRNYGQHAACPPGWSGRAVTSSSRSTPTSRTRPRRSRDSWRRSPRVLTWSAGGG